MDIGECTRRNLIQGLEKPRIKIFSERHGGVICKKQKTPINGCFFIIKDIHLSYRKPLVNLFIKLLKI